MSPIALFRPGDAPYEPYAGPPGRIDVADVVTASNSTTIAAGFVETEGGPFAYRCDYEAVCVPLDGTMTWETGSGSHRTAAGDLVWIPSGGRAAYASSGMARFVYATFPVNWPEIVGWQAGRDIKDLSAMDHPGDLAGVVLSRPGDAAFPWVSARRTNGETFRHAVVTRPGTGAAMTTMLLKTETATGWDLAAGEGLILVLHGTVVFDGGRTAQPGDLIWKPMDVPLRIETTGSGLCVSISARSPGESAALRTRAQN